MKRQPWYARYSQQAPPPGPIYLERKKVEGAECPECNSSDVRRYPIANHHGPRMVTKCQDCFHVLALDKPTEEDNWPPFRAVTYDWPASPAERASRAGVK
jgi:hypothetical protein